MAEHEVDAPRADQEGKPDPRDPGYERLLALLESADRGSSELDAQVAAAIGWRQMPDIAPCEPPPYSQSFGAALSLVPEGWQAILYTETNCAELYDATLRPRAGIKSRGEAATLPLAVCAAAIRLLARQATR